MKIPRNYRISEEVDVLLKGEAARLSDVTGSRVSEADVIELAVVQFTARDEAVMTKPRKLSRKAAQDLRPLGGHGITRFQRKPLLKPGDRK